ncbi:MAG: hypothetical protein NTZ68_01955 [Candidatus Dependentiae bacterium]|nr:hypothetical protein [Candidatus Dependentiae bacterium]
MKILQLMVLALALSVPIIGIVHGRPTKGRAVQSQAEITANYTRRLSYCFKNNLDAGSNNSNYCSDWAGPRTVAEAKMTPEELQQARMQEQERMQAQAGE